MAELRAPTSIPLSLSQRTGATAGHSGDILKPSAMIACRWDGALRDRLNRLPLESFLRLNSQTCSDQAPDLLVEQLELACLFIMEPVLPHRIHWRVLSQSEYFAVLGQAIVRIIRGLASAVQEERLWRVAALRSMGRLLTPILGIDMAASAAAASMASSALLQTNAVVTEKLEALAGRAVVSGSAGDLAAVRELLSEQLMSAVESGAAKLSTAPPVVTISAGPPSNH